MKETNARSPSGPDVQVIGFNIAVAAIKRLTNTMVRLFRRLYLPEPSFVFLAHQPDVIYAARHPLVCGEFDSDLSILRFLENRLCQFIPLGYELARLVTFKVFNP